MVRVAVVYHSGFGHTAVQARAVVRGAESVPGCEVRLLTSEEATSKLAELDSFDALVFGCPTYLGSVSAPFKAFMDASGRTWLRQGWKDKVAAGFTNSGGLSGDKLNVLIQLAVFAAQHGMIWVGPTTIPTGTGPDDLNRMGSYLGAMAQSENDKPEVTPPAGDIRTAEEFGRRVVAATQRWMAGKPGTSHPA